jgi:hypothetical protein
MLTVMPRLKQQQSPEKPQPSVEKDFQNEEHLTKTRGFD